MLRQLIEVANVAIDRQATEAGLVMLDAGGDFADGVIAYEGRRLGGEVFVSFDKGDQIARGTRLFGSASLKNPAAASQSALHPTTSRSDVAAGPIFAVRP